MINLFESGAYLINGTELIKDNGSASSALKQRLGEEAPLKQQASNNTITYQILKKHNVSGNMDKLKIKFDAIASHDITYVGIVQTARASGLEKFPLPYVLTNCHNSLCAVGGTINEDDHLFGLSAARKYGGIYVPAHLAVIHQYMREMMSGCGKMILGSDSHTRYGALGTLAIGEGGPELVKQLLGKTYDIDRPEVIAVYLTGSPNKGVGPQDVALAIIGEVFNNGYVKNKILEFVGSGIANLNVDYRNGIDVMTTETTCLSSIWTTDGKVRDYLEMHGRLDSYSELKPGKVAYYDGVVYVDLSSIKPMIAMPFHPSNTYTIEELNANLEDILTEVEKQGTKQIANSEISFCLRDKIHNGRLLVGQGVIAGCAGGTYDNICDAADIIGKRSTGNDSFSMSIYPSSMPVYFSLIENQVIPKLMTAGIVIKTAFCGPCFGAGDVPANNTLSIRHSTRNFPNREGSKPSGGQMASVALMDARSIAATAVNKGYLTPATDIDADFTKPKYYFKKEIYNNRCYDGFGKAEPSVDLKFGPNIADWPHMVALADNIVLKVVSMIYDPVTTTDELIPSGETSSYRSNPLKLAEYTLSIKDPAYVGRAKQIQLSEAARIHHESPFSANPELIAVFEKIRNIKGCETVDEMQTGFGSTIYAINPGDGSAREQAASCQKVLGGYANVARKYATKRYRSNLINWGILPFVIKNDPPFILGDYIFIPDIRKAVENEQSEIKSYVISEKSKEFMLCLNALTEDEKKIILLGCLINYYNTI